MTGEKLLSALDIAEELNVGKATIKFLLKRFKKWLPHALVGGMPYYLPESIGIVIKILEHLETGMLPGEIDEHFDTQSSSDTTRILNSSANLLQNEDIRLNKEGVALLKSLFSEFGEQQKRIAIAHEKRAAAEEKKAVAIEKRAEAEEKKAEAMNNIANALQEMNRFRDRGIEPAAQKIVHQAAKALILDETDPTYEDIRMKDAYDGSKTTEVFEEMDSDMSDLFDEGDLIKKLTAIDEPSDSLDAEMEDPLSCLNDVPETDDLSLLIEDGLLEDKRQQIELDDLSALLEGTVKAIEIEIDDLSALLDKDSLEMVITEELDDLSQLIDGSDKIKNITKETILLKPHEPMDDLNKLITPSDNQMDDLSKLIDKSVEKKVKDEVDDLSLLIEADHDPDAEKNILFQMDDLSKLIDSDETIKKSFSEEANIKKTKAIRIDISPDDDIDKYKAAIMKIILELKTEGFNAEETTLLLNKNKIRTLSGKPEWSQKAILQIYKFMTSIK